MSVGCSKITTKLASSFGSFNADQLKNWTILFSIYALKGVLPDDHIDYWRKFVLACKILCTRTLSRGNVKVANLLLISFCKKVEQAFGSECITPNMHLHIHLDRCLYDFGTVYLFWLFSFERENGILGYIPTNKRNIEIQLMRTFLKSNHAFDLFYDESTEEEFGPDFQNLKILHNDIEGGTLCELQMGTTCDIVRMSSRSIGFQSISWTIDSYNGIKLSTLKNTLLSESDVEFLSNMYKALYPDFDTNRMTVCITCRSTKYVDVYGSILGVRSGRCNRSSMILAYWHSDEGQIINFDEMEIVPRPGQIENILLYNMIVDETPYVHLLACVKWFSKPTEQMRKYYGKPVEVWTSDIYDVDGPSKFIPVQRIKSKFVHAYDTVRERKVIIVIPRERFLC